MRFDSGPEPSRSGLKNWGITTGVHPAGFAAACLYKAGREEGRWLTQAEVAAAASVSSITIRDHQDALNRLAV